MASPQVARLRAALTLSQGKRARVKTQVPKVSESTFGSEARGAEITSQSSARTSAEIRVLQSVGELPRRRRRPEGPAKPIVIQRWL